MKSKTVVFIILMAAIFISAKVYAGMAVLSEIKAAGGSVEVLKAGQKGWANATLLQSLDAGDAVRARGNAYAVVVSAFGGKAVKVSVSNSPYVLKPLESRSGRPEKARIVVNKLMDFMSGKKEEALSVPLAVRSLKRAPGLISPKDSKVLSSLPVFEWIGTPRVPYRIRIMRDDSVLWQKENIYRVQIAYPSDAPPLQPRQRYTWEIETAGYPAVRAWFEISSENDRKGLQEELRALETAGAASQFPATKALIEYGAHVARGFYAEARTLVLAALAASPDDPLLHVLLGDYYETAGLTDLAAEEYDEARFLMTIQQ